MAENWLLACLLVWPSYDSCSYAGTRYLRRGVDEDGYVGNFVETEMVSSVP